MPDPVGFRQSIQQEKPDEGWRLPTLLPQLENSHQMTASPTSPADQFRLECEEEIARQGTDQALQAATREWFNASARTKYSYHFEWMGRPIIQYPQDMIAMQEILWRVQPDILIETGVAHGGSLIFYASMMELIGKGEVLGIDIDIRSHNRAAIEAHPMFKRIRLLQGSSISPDIVAAASSAAAGKRVLVVLDSNHTHEHVLAELDAYAPLVSVGSYCVVMDTVVEDMPPDWFSDRPWDKGDNPKTAVRDYIKDHSEFEIDHAIENKIMITVAPSGYLRRVR
nr:cephalosporin hydroxylase family protein [Afipia broomeae]